MAFLSSCEIPVRKAIPYLIRPEEITPGIANWYASTFSKGGDCNSILVKTREGRPVKIEGNPSSPLSKGGVTAQTQASVLDLYDSARLIFPMKNGKQTTWEEIDKEIIEKLNTIKLKGGNIRLLSSSVYSPSTLNLLQKIKNNVPFFEHISYDAVSCSAMLKANEQTFGKKMIPGYDISSAELIVSSGADFLGSWLMPAVFTRQYAEKRKISKNKSNYLRHVQIESCMSLSGANADWRIPVAPSEEGPFLINVYNQLATISKSDRLPSVNYQKHEKEIFNLSEMLWVNRGKSLLISGSNKPAVQIIVNAINNLLGNYGKTISFDKNLLIRQGLDEQMFNLVEELKSGKVDALILWDTNPIYHYPEKNELLQGLSKVPLIISLSGYLDETSSYAHYICPEHHFLESWNDGEPQKGFYSVTQPVINPLFQTRQAQQSFMNWFGMEGNWLDYLKNAWKENVFSKQNQSVDFNLFWNQIVQEGVYTISITETIQPAFNFELNQVVPVLLPESEKRIELILYKNSTVGDGTFANNPWLQELPDTISKVCWGNYVSVPPLLASLYELEEGDMLSIRTEKFSAELPVIIQPGMADNTLAIALGYGREKSGKAGNGVGVNVYPFMKKEDKCLVTSSTVSEIRKTGTKHTFAKTQTHESLEGRPHIKETTGKEYRNNPSSGNQDRKEIVEKSMTLYPSNSFEGHHWAMSIDLSACTGCGGCVVSCMAENNIPVVGKEEISRAHEMSWLRIDRYYSGDTLNPEVVFQPMLCQHCNNAPCENVCPVAATMHSSEGLNQMVYNRCVGTRYCANNCPYKVRRFNWLDYTGADSIENNTEDPAGMTEDLPRMVLNPDVVVRSQGVMEKCSFCVQRIQEAKLNAKKENRSLKDGDIKTACEQSCPAQAIVFGDLNDTNSRIKKLYDDERMYHVLEELHTVPNVGYMTKVRI
ncbi:MAG: hypothetical protein A3H98_00140 [Bacteroidetes bacterium RIFCSPLOWO2_02_FULL_36_8]|nr:MAG: hypothetical protein A3H98_00140 [Bacteroidetes bacterium RIFCSPLOWO2_02_FULL_36_8]